MGRVNQLTSDSLWSEDGSIRNEKGKGGVEIVDDNGNTILKTSGDPNNKEITIPANISKDDGGNISIDGIKVSDGTTDILLADPDDPDGAVKIDGDLVVSGTMEEGGQL